MGKMNTNPTQPSKEPETVKVKVIELEGIKLDPNAHYIIAFDINRVIRSDLAQIGERLDKNGIAITYFPTHGDPNQVIKVYEVAPEALSSVGDSDE